MISIRKIRDLSIASPLSGRPPFLTAASGLVRAADWLYVVSDDELHLGAFPSVGSAPGRLVRLFPGRLPLEHAARKKRKPDLEALALFGPHHLKDHGALVAVPSGSAPNRTRGALLRLTASGAPLSKPSTVDFAPLYERLAREIPDLNLEGVVVTATSVKLFQRGNSKSGVNALISLSLPGFLRDLRRGLPPSPGNVRDIRPLDLGSIDGVKLTFTDAASLGGERMLFLAAAEDTDDPVLDGVSKGSVVGVIDSRGRVSAESRLDYPVKAEGICPLVRGSRLDLLMATDADDEKKPSELLAATLRGRTRQGSFYPVFA